MFLCKCISIAQSLKVLYLQKKLFIWIRHRFTVLRVSVGYPLKHPYESRKQQSSIARL